jgi:hypothetical protein
MDIALVSMLTLAFCIPYYSCYERVLHKDVLHNPHSFFHKWFYDHTRVHHMTFKFDESYHLQDKEQEHVIDMKKWAFVITGAPMIPLLIVSLSLYLFGAQLYIPVTILITSYIFAWVYYGTYEYLHYCMHLPKERQLELFWVFRKLNGHHLLHHRFMGKNFNVVLPLADWLFGTLLLRSPIKFSQARGPAVPDVQPLT